MCGQPVTAMPIHTFVYTIGIKNEQKMREVTFLISFMVILKKGSINPDCKPPKPSYTDYEVHTSELFDFLYHRISPDGISPVGGKGLMLALAYLHITR